jgi:hypothetical protein
MKKLLLGMTAAAALAVASPGVVLAQGHGGHGGGGGGGPGGGNAQMGGGGGPGGGRGGGPVGGGRSMSMHGNVSSNARGPSNFSHGGPHHMSRNHGMSRDFSSRHSRNGRYAWNGRHDHHHRHHRGDRFYFGGWWGPDYYDDYAYYDPCYQYVWTSFGYRYVNTCVSGYYGPY